jgi:hypothetical protein
MGCALLLGKPYEPLKKVPAGMGVVYIYDAGARLGQTVYIDPDLSTPSAKHYLVLATNGYYPYLTREGRVRVFEDDADNPLGCAEVSVASGEAAWVSVGQKGESLVVRAVPAAEANASLGAHRRLSRDVLGDAGGVATPTRCEGPATEPKVIDLAKPVSPDEENPKPAPTESVEEAVDTDAEAEEAAGEEAEEEAAEEETEEEESTEGDRNEVIELL